MMIGHIGPHGRPTTSDGKSSALRKILTDDGQLILEKGEKLFDVIKRDMWIRNKWSDSFFENVFDGSLGGGLTFITNKRIFHYRTKDPTNVLGHMLTSGTYQAPEKTIDIFAAKSAKRKGISDYCEIPINEIVKIETRHKRDKGMDALGKGPIHTVYVDILGNGDTYKYCGSTLETSHIEKVLADKEITRTVIHRQLMKFTVVWYQNPEELEFNKPSYKKEFVKMFNKHKKKR